jgi:hypothetical protein
MKNLRRIQRFAGRLRSRYASRFELGRPLSLTLLRFRPATYVVEHRQYGPFRLFPRIELVRNVMLRSEPGSTGSERVSGAEPASEAPASKSIGGALVGRLVERHLRVERTPSNAEARVALAPPRAPVRQSAGGAPPSPVLARLNAPVNREAAATPPHVDPAVAYPGIVLPEPARSREHLEAAVSAELRRQGGGPRLSGTEIEHVADKVMLAIDRRLSAQRERHGRRA